MKLADYIIVLNKTVEEIDFHIILGIIKKLLY